MHSQRTGVHQKETSLVLSKGERLVLSEVLSKSLDLLLKEQLLLTVLTRPGQKQDNMLKVIRWTSFNAINIESF